MERKLNIIVLFIFFMSTTALSAQVLENYDSKIRKNHQKGWLRSSYTSQVTLDLGNFPKSSLMLAIPSGTTVFMNEKLWFYSETDTLLKVEVEQLRNLFSVSGNHDVEFTALKENNRLSELSVKKGFFNKQSQESNSALSGSMDYGKRNTSVFSDFYLTSLVIILLLAAIFNVIFPIVLEYFVAPKKLITGEDFNEAGIFQKFFSIDVIFYLLMMSMLLVLNMMMAANIYALPFLSDILAGGLNSLFFYWILGSVVFVFLFVTKFIFLKILVSVFDLGKYEFSHFFYLLRLLSISLFLITLVVTYFYLNDQTVINQVVTSALWVFFWVYLVGITYLFIILVNRVSFKNYHLFAYICTAELIPFLIISKIIMG